MLKRLFKNYFFKFSCTIIAFAAALALFTLLFKSLVTQPTLETASTPPLIAPVMAEEPVVSPASTTTYLIYLSALVGPEELETRIESVAQDCVPTKPLTTIANSRILSESDTLQREATVCIEVAANSTPLDSTTPRETG